MLRYYIDTAAVAIPNYASSADEASVLLSRPLAIAAAIASDAPIEFCLMDDIEDDLWELGCGPDYNTIDEFIKMMNLERFFSANDILSSYNFLLSRAARSSEIEVAEVYVGKLDKITPTLPSELAPVKLRDYTNRTLCTAAVAAGLDQVDGVVPGWSCARVGISQISARIESFTPQTAHFGPCTPHHIIGQEVDTLTSPAALISLRRSKRVWTMAESSSELHFAISIRALEILVEKNLTLTMDAIKRFKIGSEFMLSLEQNQGIGLGRFSDLVLDVCGQIIASKCNRHIGKMGRPNQIIRQHDEALGWRVHVTDSHEALRLMYWTIDDLIEFANIGPKKELYIAHGNPLGTAECDTSSLFE